VETVSRATLFLGGGRGGEERKEGGRRNEGHSSARLGSISFFNKEKKRGKGKKKTFTGKRIGICLGEPHASSHLANPLPKKKKGKRKKKRGDGRIKRRLNALYSIYFRKKRKEKKKGSRGERREV